MRGWKNIFQANGKQKKAGVAILISDKIDLSSVQSLSCVRLFVTPWIAAPQASLSITNSRSSLKLTSVESVMPSSHLILCCPLLLLPPIPPSIRVFSNESTLRMRWPKYWSFSFNSIKIKNITWDKEGHYIMIRINPRGRHDNCKYLGQICRWHHPYGRKWRTKELLDESKRGKWKS